MKLTFFICGRSMGNKTNQRMTVVERLQAREAWQVATLLVAIEAQEVAPAAINGGVATTTNEAAIEA